ncbi:MAG: hypothetical protein ABI233_03180 [Chthoniobacterales bacterium]
MVADAVVIDGYTQGTGTVTTSDDASVNTLAAGDDAVLLIELNGVGASGGNGMQFSAGTDDSIVRGLIINGFATGIRRDGSNARVLGNFIGSDSTGQVAIPNGAGISSSGNGGHQIGTAADADRNIISGNGNGVIPINRGLDPILVQNNYIGLNRSGTSALPNSGSGIFLTGVFAGASGNIVIGATSTVNGKGTVISGNTGNGITFNVGSGSFMGNVNIQANLIGMAADGVAALGNGGGGIEDITDPASTNSGVIILHNLISANGLDGITYASDSAFVLGNQIGSDITGQLDRGNAAVGIQIPGDRRDPTDLTKTQITIGSSSSTAMNQISANKLGGIVLRNANAVIEGNLNRHPNRPSYASRQRQRWILIYNVLADPTLAVTVGGLSPTSGNVIAFNAADGVRVVASTVALQHNSIFSNGPDESTIGEGLGINLGNGPELPRMTPATPTLARTACKISPP